MGVSDQRTGMNEINAELREIKEEMQAIATKDNINYMDAAIGNLLMHRVMLLNKEFELLNERYLDMQ